MVCPSQSCAFVIVALYNEVCTISALWSVHLSLALLWLLHFTMRSAQYLHDGPSISVLCFCDCCTLQWGLHNICTMVRPSQSCALVIVALFCPDNQVWSCQQLYINLNIKITKLSVHYLCFGVWGLAFLLCTNITACKLLTKFSMEFSSSEILILLDFLLSVLTTFLL